MLYIPECASKVANGWGDLWESFYDSAYTNFVNALKEISRHGLQSHFQKRVDKILANCQSSGYGFPDMMEDAYEEYWGGRVTDKSHLYLLCTNDFAVMGSYVLMGTKLRSNGAETMF